MLGDYVSLYIEDETEDGIKCESNKYSVGSDQNDYERSLIVS